MSFKLVETRVNPYLVSALMLLARDDGLRQHGVHGKLCHSPSQLCQLSCVCQCTEGV